eukprot:CAMPEP_0206366546 /NCGR_PEP_ID=MMETSP0294-20121207/3517_1 /ASSEMBLY_ACC=CAM_ASM_000327 /TAXON_ID=39354 /ORGANISM="Heterosigma akashiwo, Strain CCMP2393" /LENGTH=275 /DNA_ID=CAMNT_0053812633 /DNA_START=115 /DNA_END=942 /DNA_ORIENTATION=-
MIKAVLPDPNDRKTDTIPTRLFISVRSFLQAGVYLIAAILIGLSIVLAILNSYEEPRLKVFAWLMKKTTQSALLDEARCEGASLAFGRVLELGPGTGANFRCWANSTAISEWVGVDPNTFMSTAMDQEYSKFKLQFPTSMKWMRGENLDVPPSSFDSVVTTHVLCSVSSVDDILRQVDRALKPGGTFFFMEHVKADGSDRTGTIIQALSAPLFAILGNGCKFKPLWENMNNLKDWGYEVALIKFDSALGRYDPCRPHVRGHATKPKERQDYPHQN